jgi:hypothetical protein
MKVPLVFIIVVLNFVYSDSMFAHKEWVHQYLVKEA